MYSPIVLFAYARREHTMRTLAALSQNILAQKSDLIVYADGAKSLSDTDAVNEVRSLLRNVSGFKSVKLVEREFNYGLANNIVSGVTEVCDKYGRVIVLEDDVITSPYFLTFMNYALDRYQDEPRVWHVSGWNYPIKLCGLNEVFFWRVMNCWGWATWANRWEKFEKSPCDLVDSWSADRISRFNLDGAIDFWSQVQKNACGELDTWAVFWYATIFSNEGLCLNPVRSLVRNIGHDGSGVNCSLNNELNDQDFGGSILKLPSKVEESSEAVSQISDYVKRTGSSRFRRFLGKILSWGCLCDRN